jgi:HEAT repeat protein
MDTLRKASGALRRTELLAGGVIVVVLSGLLIFHSHEAVYQGKSASAWVEELGDGSCAAERALREMGPDAVRPLTRAVERKPARWLEAYAALVVHAPRLLKPKLAGHYLNILRRESRLPRIRVAAAQVLGDIGPAAHQAVRALVETLGEPEATLRRNAAFALGKIGANARQAVPALANALHDRNDEVRMYAAIGLKKFGARAAQAVPALIATLKDRSWQVRERAALALGAAGQNQPSVVPALRDALRDEHRYVRASAATALALLAPHTPSALTALAQARYDPDAEVRFSAGLAMGQFDPEASAASR